MDFLNCSLSELLKCVDHHLNVLGRARLVRVLDDDELDFMASFEMFSSSMISEKDFRNDVKLYLYGKD